MAETMHNEQARQAMLDVARNYDKLADRARAIAEAKVRPEQPQE